MNRCVNWVIIGSSNDMSTVQRRVITQHNADVFFADLTPVNLNQNIKISLKTYI